MPPDMTRAKRSFFARSASLHLICEGQNASTSSARALSQGKFFSKARSLRDSCAARNGRRVQECLVSGRSEVEAAAARARAGGVERRSPRRLERLHRVRRRGWHPHRRFGRVFDSHAHRLETGSQGGCVLQRQRCPQNAESSENDRAPHDKMFRSSSGQKQRALTTRPTVLSSHVWAILTMKSYGSQTR